MITDEMCIAAAKELARVAEKRGLNEDRIMPSMGDREVFPREATAVGLHAMKQGLARLKLSRQELYDRAAAIIGHARMAIDLLMRQGVIKPFPHRGLGGQSQRKRSKMGSGD